MSVARSWWCEDMLLGVGQPVFDALSLALGEPLG